jgi:hypothetical protein
MSHRSNPPRQSAVQRKRMPVTSHDRKASVGHQIGSRKKAVDDPKNGEWGVGTYSPGSAPGSNGPATC